MSDRGAIKKTMKTSQGDPPIPVTTGAWVTVARFTTEDVGTRTLGWSLMDGEVYAKLPAVLPRIQSRWLRHVGTLPLDPTKRTGLVVAERDWGAVIPATIEYLTPDDFPLELQIKASSGGWSVNTAIAAIVAPATYAASRLTIGDDA